MFRLLVILFVKTLSYVAKLVECLSHKFQISHLFLARSSLTLRHYRVWIQSERVCNLTKTHSHCLYGVFIKNYVLYVHASSCNYVLSKSSYPIFCNWNAKISKISRYISIEVNDALFWLRFCLIFSSEHRRALLVLQVKQTFMTMQGFIQAMLIFGRQYTIILLIEFSTSIFLKSYFKV